MSSQTNVFLVGAGPGDPSLITVRGLELLREAEVVLYDALVHRSLLDECSGAELHDVGKRFGERAVPQPIITEKLIHFARQGRRVVRLKGGDPLLFARGAEETLALTEAGIPFEIVPGLSSPVATSGYAGIPLTHRDLSSSVTFITGSDREGKAWSPDAWHKLATATDTLCILMGMRQIERITQALIEGGRSPDTPVAVIHSGARPEQKVAVAPLAEIAAVAREQGLTNPAVIVVGQVVGLREHLAWYERRPLFGKRILLPRTPEQAAPMVRSVLARGGQPQVVPLIELGPPSDDAPLRQALAQLERYAWVVFTSSNGVDFFFRALKVAGKDTRAFGSARVAAIGPKTAEAIEAQSIVPDLIAPRFVAEDLAQAFLEQSSRGDVLLPRAEVARDVFPDALRAAGIAVDIVPVYRKLPLSSESVEQLRELFTQGAVDAVCLTASSTVDALLDALGDQASTQLESVTLAAIGPATARTLENRGFRAQVVARESTTEGLLGALQVYYEQTH